MNPLPKCDLPQYLLDIQTNTFIIPHFQIMGAYCTGHEVCSSSNEDLRWFNQDAALVEATVHEFLEENCTPIQEIDYIDIGTDLATPFIPTRDLNKYSDGFGNLLSIDLPDSEKKGLRNKNIERFFAKRIKTIKRFRQNNWRLNVTFQHNLKTQLQKQKLKTFPAFTGLGIITRGYLSSVAEETIMYKARMYAFENEFEITGYSIKKLDPIHLSSIDP